MVSSKDIVVRHTGSFTCKYHRKIGETYDINHLGPEGLCLDLYFNAYPYFLSLLEGAEFSWMEDKDKVYAQCPKIEGVHFEVRRVPLEKIIESEGIKKTNKFLLKIIGIEEKIGEYENDCICLHEIGEEFEFNQGNFLDQMCPAAFYSIYPTLKVILSGGKPSWQKDGNVYVQCPDNLTKIMFEIITGEKGLK